MVLDQYEMEIKYRSSKKMEHVDALSRVASVRVIKDFMVDRIRRAESRDPELKAILRILENFMLRHGLMVINSSHHKA